MNTFRKEEKKYDLSDMDQGSNALEFSQAQVESDLTKSLNINNRII